MGNSGFVKKIKNWLSKPAEQPPANIITKTWSLEIKGELTNIKKLNIDKSGKNPAYLLYGTIKVESYKLEGTNFEVPGLLDFKGKETDLKKQTEQVFTVGEKINLKFTGTELPTDRFVFK